MTESPAPVVCPPPQEEAAYKRLGLTKQVLAAHTQKEEQAFLSRCRELRPPRTSQKDCSTHLRKQRGTANAEGTSLTPDTHTHTITHTQTHTHTHRQREGWAGMRKLKKATTTEHIFSGSLLLNSDPP